MPGKGLFQGGLAFTDAAVTARECTVPLGPDGRGALLLVPCTMKPLAAARRFRLTALCAHAPGEAPPGEAEAAALALDSVDVCTLPPPHTHLSPIPSAISALRGWSRRLAWLCPDRLRSRLPLG